MIHSFIQSSVVVLGSRKIWRIDPTGQFWDCQATVLGQDADRAEEELYRRLLKECNNKKLGDVRELLESMSHNETLAFAKDFLQTRITKQQQKTHPIQSSSTTTTTRSSSSSSSSHDTESTKKNDLVASDLSSQVYWQAVILDYSSSTSRGTPRRTLKRGTFGVRNKI